MSNVNEGYVLSEMISTKKLINSDNNFKMSKDSFEILITNINVLQTEFMNVYENYKKVFSLISEQENGEFKNFYDYLIKDIDILNYIDNRKIISKDVVKISNIITGKDINLMFGEVKKVYQIGQKLYEEVQNFLEELFYKENIFDNSGYILQFSTDYFEKIKSKNYLRLPFIDSALNFIKDKDFSSKNYFYNNWVSQTSLFKEDYPMNGTLADSNELGIFAQIFQGASQYLNNLNIELEALKEGYLYGEINKSEETESISTKIENFYFGYQLNDEDLIVTESKLPWEKTIENFFILTKEISRLKEINFNFDNFDLSVYNNNIENHNSYISSINCSLFLNDKVVKNYTSTDDCYLNSMNHFSSYRIDGGSISFRPENNQISNSFSITYKIASYTQYKADAFKINTTGVNPTDNPSTNRLTITETYYKLKIESFD